MVRAVDIVSQILREYSVKAAESHRAKQIRDKEQWEECRRLVDETKENFANIVEGELRKQLDENPAFNKNMHINVMPIPDAVIEEHIRLSGQISVRSSKIPMLQELVDLAKKEGLEPFIYHWGSEIPGKKYDAFFQVMIPEDLIQKVLIK